jgi:hypothetical protein
MNEQDMIKHIVNQGSNSQQMMTMLTGLLQKISYLSVGVARQEEHSINNAIVNKEFEGLVNVLFEILIEKNIITKDEVIEKSSKVRENTEKYIAHIKEQLETKVEEAKGKVIENEKVEKKEEIIEEENNSSVVLASERFNKKEE